MFVKNKIVRFTIIAVLVLVCFYNGICCAATLHRAITQAYLLSGTVRIYGILHNFGGKWDYMFSFGCYYRLFSPN